MRAPDIVRARMAIETPPPPQDGEAWLLPGFDRLYGLQITYITEDEARAHVVVRDELLQPGGLVHGGVFAAIAESLSSAATWYGVAREGKVAQGMSNQTSFLRPILAGTIHAVARRRHRGRTTWVWEVDILDDAERVCALVRMTVAVREAAA
jgi:1,4-dihydroxy-2-naphthoyl-CoA hydrolase